MARGDFKLKLTDNNVKNLPADPGRRREYSDTVMPGLKLRVSENGHRSYLFQYRKDGKQWRFTIGNIKAVSLAGARETARSIVRGGGNPAATKREAINAIAGVTADSPAPYRFSDLCDDFVKDQRKEWRQSTAAAWTRFIEKEIKPAHGHKAPSQITPADIRDHINGIRNGIQDGVDAEGEPAWKRVAAPTSARRCFEVVRRIFAWAVYKGHVAISPCVAAQPFERRRKRKMLGSRLKPFTDDQLRGIFAAIEDADDQSEDAARFALLVHLVARTAVRSHEARSARPSDVRNGVWSIPPEFHKNGVVTGRPHLVPLSKGAKKLFDRIGHDGMWCFPAATTKCRICPHAGHMDPPNARTTVAPLKKAAGIEDFGFLHRFRDTVKTRMSEHGIAERVSEHILGHVLPGIAGVYDHSELLQQRREALEWWDNELGRILSAKRRKKTKGRAA